jgi:hypothetical protein
MSGRCATAHPTDRGACYRRNRYSDVPEIATTPEIYEAVVSRFKAMTPFLEFLDAPLAARGRKPIDARELLG